MPISAYFKGSGDKVMANLQKQYGEKQGKSAFYAIANEQGQNPPKKSRRYYGEKS